MLAFRGKDQSSGRKGKSEQKISDNSRHFRDADQNDPLFRLGLTPSRPLQEKIRFIAQSMLLKNFTRTPMQSVHDLPPRNFEVRHVRETLAQDPDHVLKVKSRPANFRPELVQMTPQTEQGSQSGLALRIPRTAKQLFFFGILGLPQGLRPRQG